MENMHPDAKHPLFTSRALTNSSAQYVKQVVLRKKLLYSRLSLISQEVMYHFIKRYAKNKKCQGAKN